jgi:hypothetical protein
LNPSEPSSEGFGQLALSALLTTTLLTGLAATIGVLVLLPGGLLPGGTTLLTALMLIILATVLAALTAVLIALVLAALAAVLIALMLATLLALLLIHRCLLGICPFAYRQPPHTRGVPRIRLMPNLSACSILRLTLYPSG